MKLTILGCGTSSGVPRIGNDWGACDPSEPKNRRTRVSILVEEGEEGVLVDTSPDMRAQFLAQGISQISTVLWTHDHADHCHGIDDLRQIFHHRREPVPAYGSERTITALRRRFYYAFEGNQGYPPICDGRILAARETIGHLHISSTEQPHGGISSTGLRFESRGKALGYAIDFHKITDRMVALYQGCDLLVVDSLRERPHPTHAHLEMSLELIARSRAKRALLTHMDKSMDYASLCKSLPDHVRPAHDGLTAEL